LSKNQIRLEDIQSQKTVGPLSSLPSESVLYFNSRHKYLQRANGLLNGICMLFVPTVALHGLVSYQYAGLSPLTSLFVSLGAHSSATVVVEGGSIVVLDPHVSRCQLAVRRGGSVGVG